MFIVVRWRSGLCGPGCSLQAMLERAGGPEGHGSHLHGEASKRRQRQQYDLHLQFLRFANFIIRSFIS